MKTYVLGFMFSKDRNYVALIRKTHPDWQAGKLNGIGGEVAEDELPVKAMVREFEEEAGCSTKIWQWRHFAGLDGKDFTVQCFVATGDLSVLKTMTEEKLDVRLVNDMRWYVDKLVDNCAWLIHLALDHLDDGRPDFVLARYR